MTRIQVFRTLAGAVALILAATLAISCRCADCCKATHGAGACARQTDDERTGITVTGGAAFNYGASPMPVTLTDLTLDSTGGSFVIEQVSVYVGSSSTQPSSPGTLVENVTSLNTDYHVISAAALNVPASTHDPAVKYCTIWVVVQGKTAGNPDVYDAKRIMHPLHWDPKPFQVTKRP